MKNYIGDGFLENINDIIQTKHKKKKIVVTIKDGYCCEMKVTGLKAIKLDGQGDVTYYYDYVKLESKKDCVLHLYAESIQIDSLCKIINL